MRFVPLVIAGAGMCYSNSYFFRYTMCHCVPLYENESIKDLYILFTNCVVGLGDENLKIVPTSIKMLIVNDIHVPPERILQVCFILFTVLFYLLCYTCLRALFVLYVFIYIFYYIFSNN